MFSIKDYNRGSSLCYDSMITTIMKHFGIGVSNLLHISPGLAQEFNKSTLTNMGYHWDDINKVYFYHMKGSGKVIYNYDDSTEFGPANVEEQPIDDQAHHVDTKKVDTNHEDDEVWLHVKEKHEDPQERGQWK